MTVRWPVAIRSVTRAAWGTVARRLGRSQRVTAEIKATFAPRQAADFDETLTPLPASQLRDPTLPFLGASSPSSAPPEFTLEQYASLPAELSVSPERAAEILARYGLRDQPQRRALDAVWQRFSSNSKLRDAWHELHQRFRAWLLSARR